MQTSYSNAASLRLNLGRKPAYIILVAFLASVFVLNGAAASAVVIICFVASWSLIAKEARDGSLSIPHVPLALLVFLVAISLRLLLPPTGSADAIPGLGISRALLIVGLFGLTLYVSARLSFKSILRLIAGAAFATTIIALGIYLHNMPEDHRLLFIGRAAHPIQGAGAVTTGVVAAVSLLAYQAGEKRLRTATALLLVVISTLIFALYLTGSRGPLLSLGWTLAATPLVMICRSRALLFVCAIGAWFLVTASVLFEAPIREALCPLVELACRAPNRHEAWSETLHSIAQHPLWGNGYGFRFHITHVPHAHNSYLGAALHYGIPMCILFVWLMMISLSATTRIRQPNEKLFVVAMLIFANGYMGSDLSDPMRFFNTHYLFLWFPMFLALCACPERTPQIEPPKPSQPAQAAGIE